MRHRLIKNSIECKKCGDVITSKHRHDFKMCKCESIFIDGGLDYHRLGGSLEDIIDRSEWEVIDEKK
jgi:hypothetical protein